MPTQDRPNILLITTDQQRYDTLGCNGAPQVRTPHIDALAARGSRFTNAYIQNPVCIPSRACMQTGRYTSQHGVNYMESIIDTTPGLPPWERTIMERLQATGYATAAFGKIHMMPERGFDTLQICGGKGGRWTKSHGLEIGPGPLGNHYATWLEERHPGGYELIYEQRRRPEYKQNNTAITNILPLEEYVDYWIGQNAVDYISRPRSEPWFVWCGFCGPHGPIDPPKPYDSLYRPEDIILPENFFVDRNGEPREPSAEEEKLLRYWIALYYGLCTLIDDQVGCIMDAMTRRGLWENTLVLYVTDHGEMLGERGAFGKGNFFDPIIHAPFIVTPPAGHAPPPVIDGLVETMDIAPTVLDYAGLPIPEEMQATNLRPLLEGEGGGKDAILCEHTTNNRERSGKCVRTERYKYCYWSPGEREEFYDMQADPLERNNAIDDPEYQEEINNLRRKMIDILMDAGRKHVLKL